jgi:D-alanyl-D-alanine dipeptidase
MVRKQVLIFATLASSLATMTLARAELPRGFVYLSDVAPDIVQDMRYATAHNFVGRPIAGYQVGECIVTDKAAKALAGVQAELKKRNLSLVMWDCYRPVRAVHDFVTWSKNPGDAKMKTEFFPRSDKAQLFALGYLASRSGHSRGSTVDLGIVPAGTTAPKHDAIGPLVSCTAPKGQRFNDGAIDFGTGYDCLDPLASTRAPGISSEALGNRLLLSDLMVRHGFKPYHREWWHFELANEPFPHQSFDFPIASRSAVSTGAGLSENEKFQKFFAAPAPDKSGR